MAAWADRTGLQDISNLQHGQQAGGGGRHKQTDETNAQLFLEMIEAGGLMGWQAPEGAMTGMLEVVDPRRLRRHLETRLQRDAALRQRWLEGLQEACEEQQVLYRALLPMVLAAAPSVGSVTSAGGAGSCGDSFMRCVLSVACLQAPVATWLLQRLPVLAMAEPTEGSSEFWMLAEGGGGGGGNGAGRGSGSVPGLLLSQLRWLDVAPDCYGGNNGDDEEGEGSPLVGVVLEVLPLTPPALQRQLIGLLPELATVGDHERIVARLAELLDSESAFVAPALEALQQLQLEPHLQDQVVLDMAERLPGVDADDLPALVRFIVQYSTGPAAAGPASSGASATAPRVLAALRSGLPLVDLTDPRVSVPDRKGKRGGGRGGAREPVEVRLLREVAVALAANDAACCAVLRAITATGRTAPRTGSGGSSAPDLEPDPEDDEAAEDPDPEGRGGGAAAAAALAGGPSKLVPLDFWILLTLLGGRRGKEADKILRSKITDGSASPAWLSEVLLGHSAALKEVWAAAAALAGGLAGSKPAGGPLAAAAARLYAVMFAAMAIQDDSLQRIEVLHALHSHLGSGVAEEVDTALAALAQLAEGPLSRPAGASSGGCNGTGGPSPPTLSQYGSALSNCLDHLEGFNDGQLAALFDILSAVTGGAEGVAWRAAAEARAEREAAGSSGGGCSRRGVVRIAGGAGGRLESEVQIVVDKALKGSLLYKRIGIAGALSYIRRVGSAMALLECGGDDGDGGGGGGGGASAADGVCTADGFDLLFEEWKGRLEDLVAATEGPGQGGSRAMALGLLYDMLKRPVRHPAGGGGGGGGAWGSKIPAAALVCLLELVQVNMLEGCLIMDRPTEGREATSPEVRIPGCIRPISCAYWMEIPVDGGEPDEEGTCVAIKLWPLAASSSPLDRDVLVWMGPCLRLLCYICHLNTGNLTDVDALLVCPLAMFPMDLIQDAEGVNELHELPPAVTSAVLTCLQAASSWLREVLNCFGPTIARGGANGGSLQDEDIRAKLAKRAAQLASLEALAVALADNIPPPRGGLAALQVLRNHADPVGRLRNRTAAAAGAAALAAAAAPAGAAKKGRAAGAAAATGTAASRAAAALSLRRCLRPLTLPGVFAAMRPLLTSMPPGGYQVAGGGDGGGGGGGAHDWGAWTVLPNRLAAAAYLVSELACKAGLVVARARNAAPFTLARPAMLAAAADSSLEGLKPAELAAQLAEVMPCVRQHLDSATAALAGSHVLAPQHNVYLQPASDGDGTRVLASLDAVQPALDPAVTAVLYTSDALDLLRLFFTLFAPPSARGRAAAAAATAPPTKALVSALGSLAAKPASDGVPDAELRRLMDAARPSTPGRQLTSAQADCLSKLALLAFKQLSSQCRGTGPATDGGAAPNPPSAPDVWRHLALLRVGRSLLTALRHLTAPLVPPEASTVSGGVAAGGPHDLRRLAVAISRSANSALENAWGSSGSAAGGGSAAAGEDDDDAAGGGGDDDLEAAAGGGGGGAAAAAAGGTAGGGFRWRGQPKLICELLQMHVKFSEQPLAVMKQLAEQVLTEVPEGRPTGSRGAAAAAASEPIAGYASLSEATLAAWYRGTFEALADSWATTCARLRAAERKVPGQEEEDELVSETAQSTEVFARLMELVRRHASKTPMINTATKFGGKFVEELSRSTGAWRRMWARHEERLRRTVRQVQRGTRLLNAMCADGKERRAVALAKNIPAAKRANEAFMLNMRALFHEMGAAGAIRIAQLRNKDIHGNEVPSQAYDDDDDGGDGDGGEELYGIGGDEEEEADGDAGGDGDRAAAQQQQQRNKPKKKRSRAKKDAAGSGAAADGADGHDGCGDGADAPAGPKVKKPRAPRQPKEPGEGGQTRRGRKAKDPAAAAVEAGPAGAGGSGDGGGGPAASHGLRMKREEESEAAAAAAVGPAVQGQRAGKRARKGASGEQQDGRATAGASESDLAVQGWRRCSGGSDVANESRREEEDGGEDDMYGELHGNRRGLYGEFDQAEDGEEEEEEEAVEGDRKGRRAAGGGGEEEEEDGEQEGGDGGGGGGGREGWGGRQQGNGDPYDY